MSHDPMCPNISSRFSIEDNILWPAVCECLTIAATRSDEQARIVNLLQSKVCETPNCGHTACVAYSNAIRLVKGIAI